MKFPPVGHAPDYRPRFSFDQSRSRRSEGGALVAIEQRDRSRFGRRSGAIGRGVLGHWQKWNRSAYRRWRAMGAVASSRQDDLVSISEDKYYATLSRPRQEHRLGSSSGFMRAARGRGSQRNAGARKERERQKTQRHRAGRSNYSRLVIVTLAPRTMRPLPIHRGSGTAREPDWVPLNSHAQSAHHRY